MNKRVYVYWVEGKKGHKIVLSREKGLIGNVIEDKCIQLGMVRIRMNIRPHWVKSEYIADFIPKQIFLGYRVSEEMATDDMESTQVEQG